MFQFSHIIFIRGSQVVFYVGYAEDLRHGFPIFFSALVHDRGLWRKVARDRGRLPHKHWREEKWH